MTLSGGGPAPSPAFITTGGVFLPAHLAEPVWRTLREAILVRQRDGGRVRPEMQQALDVLRGAALAHLSASGLASRTYADVPAASAVSAVLPTSALASRLGVSERHARRVARAEGVEPVARNCWAREDVAALAARRSPP